LILDANVPIAINASWLKRGPRTCLDQRAETPETEASVKTWSLGIPSKASSEERCGWQEGGNIKARWKPEYILIRLLKLTRGVSLLPYKIKMYR
jgi:hypothetical protein